MSSISRCKRLMNMAFAKIINMVPISGELRYRLIRYSGVKTLGKRGFIGKNVSFDSIRPDLIEIEDGAYVTEACIVYTHYLIPDTFVTRKGSWFRFGRVVIKKNAFVGARTIICNDVGVGENAIVAAGSVVTKDIPPYELWGGTPAKFIRKLQGGQQITG